jgi:hypothetical protein
MERGVHVTPILHPGGEESLEDEELLRSEVSREVELKHSAKGRQGVLDVTMVLKEERR